MPHVLDNLWGFQLFMYLVWTAWTPISSLMSAVVSKCNFIHSTSFYNYVCCRCFLLIFPNFDAFFLNLRLDDRHHRLFHPMIQLGCHSQPTSNYFYVAIDIPVLSSVSCLADHLIHSWLYGRIAAFCLLHAFLFSFDAIHRPTLSLEGFWLAGNYPILGNPCIALPTYAISTLPPHCSLRPNSRRTEESGPPRWSAHAE